MSTICQSHFDLDPLSKSRIETTYGPRHCDLRLCDPRLCERVQLEHGFAPSLLRDVRAMGYDPVPPSPGYARLYVIVRRGDRWIGVADTRHDGQPRGY